MMYNNYIREATEEEMAIYNKVENAFGDDEIESFCEAVYDEEISDLLQNKIRNADTVAIIKAKGLTVAEVCTWYFIS